MPTLYWSTADYPALRHLAPAEQRQLSRRYVGRAMRRAPFWIRLLICLAFFTAIVRLASAIFLPRFLSLDSPLNGWLPILVGEFIGLFLWMQIQARALNRQILQDNPHLCQACGYDLRATPMRCPECGTVASAHLRSA